MNYITIIMAIIGFITPAKDMKISKETKAVIIAFLMYYFYTKLKDSETVDSIKSNITNDQTGQDAVRLFEALHPINKTKLPLIGYLSDGTDETTALQIARSSGVRGDFNTLANYYEALYKVNLSDDLVSEGIFDDFMSAYNSASAVKSNGTAPNGVQVSTGKYIVTGKNYTLKGGWNLRKLDGTVGRVSIANEKINIRMINQNKTIAGIKGTWCFIGEVGNIWNEYYWINLSAINPA